MTTAPHNDGLTFRSIEPAVFTAAEAIVYLRLDVGKSEAAAQAALNRLVDRKLLRPAMYRRERMFTHVELDRFLAARVQEYGALAE